MGITLAISLFGIKCSNIQFNRSPNSIGGKNPLDENNGDRPSPPPEDIGPPSATNGIFDFVSAVSKSSVWVATNYNNGMKIYLISINRAKNYPAKQWFISERHGSGMRTYVSEIGLLIGKYTGSGIVLYRIDPDFSTNHQFTPVWKTTNILSGTRICPTFFKIREDRYAAIAWQKSNRHRQFTRIPVDPSLPEKLDVNSAITVDLGGGRVNGDNRWAYSCYMDQRGKNFWGGWLYKSFFGINVHTMIALDHKIHPTNRGHTNTALGEYFLNPASGENGSYALSGGMNGAILTGRKMYTFTHERRHRLVYGSQQSAAGRRLRLLVAREACFTTLTNCSTGQLIWVNLDSVTDGDGNTVGHITAMSSLNDGRIIGIVRGDSNSQVYLISPQNPEDLSQGINFTRIATVDGNAYMYNDFTGGTLFAREFNQIVDLTQLEGWVNGKALRSLAFTWTAQAGGFSAWRGLILKARCYRAGSKKPDFEPITNIKGAAQITVINVSSCINKEVDKLELRLQPETDGPDFTRTSQIKIMGMQ